MAELGIDEVRERARELWALGDYRPIGEQLEPAAQTLVERAGIRRGDRVLDVGVGTGNVALAALARGATVTGLDIADTWFPVVRDRANSAGVELELVIGDAEDLAVTPGSYDVVASSFAAVFAPRHQHVADAFVRAVSPGGTVALTAWPPSPELVMPHYALVRRLPPPPAWVGDPGDWADPDYTADRFGDQVGDWRVETATIDWGAVDVPAFERLMFEDSGPVRTAHEMLAASGALDDALDEFRQVLADTNLATDGSVRLEVPYRILVGTRR